MNVNYRRFNIIRNSVDQKPSQIGATEQKIPEYRSYSLRSFLKYPFAYPLQKIIDISDDFEADFDTNFLEPLLPKEEDESSREEDEKEEKKEREEVIISFLRYCIHPLTFETNYEKTSHEIAIDKCLKNDVSSKISYFKGQFSFLNKKHLLCIKPQLENDQITVLYVTPFGFAYYPSSNDPQHEKYLSEDRNFIFVISHEECYIKKNMSVNVFAKIPKLNEALRFDYPLELISFINQDGIWSYAFSKESSFAISLKLICPLDIQIRKDLSSLIFSAFGKISLPIFGFIGKFSDIISYLKTMDFKKDYIKAIESHQNPTLFFVKNNNTGNLILYLPNDATPNDPLYYPITQFCYQLMRRTCSIPFIIPENDQKQTRRIEQDYYSFDDYSENESYGVSNIFGNFKTSLVCSKETQGQKMLMATQNKDQDDPVIPDMTFQNIHELFQYKEWISQDYMFNFEDIKYYQNADENEIGLEQNILNMIDDIFNTTNFNNHPINRQLFGELGYKDPTENVKDIINSKKIIKFFERLEGLSKDFFDHVQKESVVECKNSHLGKFTNENTNRQLSENNGKICEECLNQRKGIITKQESLREEFNGIIDDAFDEYCKTNDSDVSMETIDESFVSVFLQYYALNTIIKNKEEIIELSNRGFNCLDMNITFLRDPKNEEDIKFYEENIYSFFKETNGRKPFIQSLFKDSFNNLDNPDTEEKKTNLRKFLTEIILFSTKENLLKSKPDINEFKKIYEKYLIYTFKKDFQEHYKKSFKDFSDKTTPQTPTSSKIKLINLKHVYVSPSGLTISYTPDYPLIFIYRFYKPVLYEENFFSGYPIQQHLIAELRGQTSGIKIINSWYVGHGILILFHIYSLIKLAYIPNNFKGVFPTKTIFHEFIYFDTEENMKEGEDKRRRGGVEKKKKKAKPPVAEYDDETHTLVIFAQTLDKGNEPCPVLILYHISADHQSAIKITTRDLRSFTFFYENSYDPLETSWIISGLSLHESYCLASFKSSSRNFVALLHLPKFSFIGSFDYNNQKNIFFFSEKLVVFESSLIPVFFSSKYISFINKVNKNNSCILSCKIKDSFSGNFEYFNINHDDSDSYRRIFGIGELFSSPIPIIKHNKKFSFYNRNYITDFSFEQKTQSPSIPFDMKAAALLAAETTALYGFGELEHSNFSSSTFVYPSECSRFDVAIRLNENLTASDDAKQKKEFIDAITTSYAKVFKEHVKVPSRLWRITSKIDPFLGVIPRPVPEYLKAATNYVERMCSLPLRVVEGIRESTENMELWSKSWMLEQILKSRRNMPFLSLLEQYPERKAFALTLVSIGNQDGSDILSHISGVPFLPLKRGSLAIGNNFLMQMDEDKNSFLEKDEYTVNFRSVKSYVNVAFANVKPVDNSAVANAIAIFFANCSDMIVYNIGSEVGLFLDALKAEQDLWKPLEDNSIKYSDNKIKDHKNHEEEDTEEENYINHRTSAVFLVKLGVDPKNEAENFLNEIKKGFGHCSELYVIDSENPVRYVAMAVSEKFNDVINYQDEDNPQIRKSKELAHQMLLDAAVFDTFSTYKGYWKRFYGSF